jgi:3-oxoacyl-[acyl-carrier-protein] synthase-3
LWDLLYSSYRNGNSQTPETLREIDEKPFDLKMDGNPLFKRAVGYLSDIAREALTHNALASEDIGLFVPHQANIRIIQGMAKNLRIPMEKVYTNVHKYGNTSSASIPLALDEANREGRMKTGDHVLLVAFGAGLTWASSMLKWVL